MRKNYNKYYVYTPRQISRQQIPPKARRSFKKPLLVIVAVFLIFGFYLSKVQQTAAKNANKAEQIALKAERDQERAVLAKTIRTTVEDNSNVSFSVTAIDLSDNSVHQFGEKKAMDAASTAKLVTASLFLNYVENGKVSLEKKFDGKSAKAHLKELVKNSDDEAWQILNDYLGHDALSAYAKKNSINSYDPDAGVIAASDLALLLKKLYKKELLNDAHTKLLLSYMQNTNYEEYISPAIRENAKIYHKVGLADDQVNDAAIITKEHKSYVLVIFTNGEGSYDFRKRAEIMQNIATASSKAFLN